MITGSDRNAAASQQQRFSDLREKNRLFTEERLARTEVEARYAAEQVKRQESADSQQDGLRRALADFDSEFSDAFGDDPTAVADARAFFDSLVRSFFDPESVLSASLSDPSVLSLDRVLTDPAYPESPVERYPDPWTEKSSVGANPCQRSLVASVVSTVRRVVAGSVSNVSRALRAVQVSLGLASSSEPGIGDALAAVAARTLLEVLGGQDLVVAQLSVTAKKIADLSGEMTDKDYLFNHAAFIRAQQAQLVEADRILAGVEADLLTINVFDGTSWDAAAAIIKRVSEQLRRLGLSDILSGLSSRPLRLLLLASYAGLLVGVLRRYQAISDRILGSLLTFPSQFAAVSFDNLFGPVVDLIRCRVRKVIEDMDAAIERNSVFFYVLKEKQWSVELAAVAAAMRAARKIDLPGKIDRFSGTEFLRRAFSQVNDFFTAAPARDLTAIIGTAQVMIDLANQKAAINSPAAPVVAAAQATIDLCDAYTSSADAGRSVLSGYASAVIVAAPSAVRVVERILKFAKDRQCDEFTVAVAEGRISDAFAIDSLTTSVEGSASSLIAHILAAVEAGGGDRQVSADLLLVNQTFQDSARSRGLLDSLLHDYGSRHIADRVEAEGAALRANDERIRRAASAAGQPQSSRSPVFVPVSRARAEHLARTKESS